jgi:hypothetical protein
MTRFRAVLRFSYRGKEVEPDAEIEAESDEDFAELELMMQRGGVTVISSGGGRTPPMKTETGPNPPEKKPAEDKPAHPQRHPGARPEGYGRRDMKPGDNK